MIGLLGHGFFSRVFWGCPVALPPLSKGVRAERAAEQVTQRTMLGGLGDTAGIAAALARTRRRGHEATEAARIPAPPPVEFDAGLDEGPQAGKAYPRGELYPRRAPGPHPYDCVPPGARRPVRFPHGASSVLEFLRSRNPNFDGKPMDIMDGFQQTHKRTRPLGKGDFLKVPKPYRLAWQSITPDSTQGKKMRDLQKALGAHEQGDSAQLEAYCWKDIREVLEACDKTSSERPQTTHDPTHTPLHKACWRGDIDAVRQLITGTHKSMRTRLVTAANKIGATPLHLCCDGSRPFFAGATGRCDIARLCLAAGALVDARGTRGQTPLHKACYQGDALLCKVLLEAGADENAIDENERVPTSEAEARRQPPHVLDIATAIDSVIGPERAAHRRLKCTASAYVRKFVQDAVARSRPPLPYAHQLYRDKKFPRANSRDPSRAKMMAKKSRYQTKKGTDRQKKQASNF